MNKGQEQFQQYILERVQSGHEAEAKALLLDSFLQQEDGSFSKEDLTAFHSALLPLLNPEYKDEVVAVLTQYGDSHING